MALFATHYGLTEEHEGSTVATFRVTCEAAHTSSTLSAALAALSAWQTSGGPLVVSERPCKEILFTKVCTAHVGSSRARKKDREKGRKRQRSQRESTNRHWQAEYRQPVFTRQVKKGTREKTERGYELAHSRTDGAVVFP